MVRARIRASPITLRALWTAALPDLDRLGAEGHCAVTERERRAPSDTTLARSPRGIET
jgi:hypothetical protein